MEEDYLDTFVGEKQEVLFEEVKQGHWRGYTTRYVEVTVESAEDLHNQLRMVTITGREGVTLRGTLN